jgi:TM2 domain-containing membrane protein YozV
MTQTGNHHMATGQSSAPPAGADPHSGVSSDTRALMLFEANKKTALLAYVLWFFLGIFGAHNFYLERTGVAIAQLILSLTLVGMLITFVWVIVDAFLIPGWVRRLNNQLAAQLGA